MIGLLLNKNPNADQFILVDHVCQQKTFKTLYQFINYLSKPLFSCFFITLISLIQKCFQYIFMSENSQVLQKAEQFFLQYIEEIQRDKISDISIRRALKKYDVKNLKIHNVTPLRAKKMYLAIIPKYSSGFTTDKSWLENQRRLFIWCTVCYLHKNSLEINDLKCKDFEFLKRMFPLKELELIKFQINSLVKKDNKNSSWTIQQDNLLRELTLQQNLKQIEWSTISKKFFQKSHEQFFRNAKQCRQRWLNHLDPNKTKGKWQIEQDIILLRNVLNKGKKWSKIVQALDNKKNEHMIKNRYKSLIHKKQKSSKNPKLKQKDIIQLILKQYQENPKQQSEQQDSQSMEQQVSKEQVKEKQQYSYIKPSFIRNQIYIQEQNYAKPHSYSPKCSSLPIIVEPKPYFRQDQNQKGEQTQKQYQNKNQLMLHVNNKAEKQFVNSLFYSVNTPIAEQNRIPPIILQNRSPAGNVFLSPFPACWTPTIFLVDDVQSQPSPKIQFANFSTRFKSTFNSFIQQK